MCAANSSPNRFEIVVEDGAPRLRLDLYLTQHAEVKLTRNRIQKLIDDQLITVNGKPADKKTPVKPGDKIAIVIVEPPPTDIKAENIPLEIVYEDAYLIVINKPAWLVTHPGAGNYSGTLVNALVHHFSRLARGSGSDRPGIVHRLDKDTSGLLLIARTDESYQKLQQALQAREIKRTYLALVCGHMKEEKGTIDLPIGRSLRNRKRMVVTTAASRGAITHYSLVRRFRSYDLLDVSLETGRTHQIRVHFSHLGHPVFGDPEYGGREKWHRGQFAPERPLARKLLELISRQALHARRLELDHPVTGKPLVFEVPPPEDFRTVLKVLESELV